jgi:hypothetical protein
VDSKPEVAQQREVPKEDAVVKPVKKRRNSIGARSKLQSDARIQTNSKNSLQGKGPGMHH